MKRWFSTIAMVGTILLATPDAGRAEAPSPAKAAGQPVRSGLWRQWIVWLRPGTAAAAALERTVTRVNVVRGAKALPALKTPVDRVLVFSAIEETDPRGPAGASLKDGNREMFFATFVDVEGGGSYVLFLQDPLRSNGALTQAGVPGTTANITASWVNNWDATSTVSTSWKAESQKDKVEFEASYSTLASIERRSFPPAPDYFSGTLARSLVLLYEPRPTEPIELWERSSSVWIDMMTSKNAKTKLKVNLRDPDLQAMFSDPENLPVRLVELARQVRFMR